jgi:hypothetical protein
MKTVQQLRQAGYKVRIQHFRYPYRHACGVLENHQSPVTRADLKPEKEFRSQQAVMEGRGGKTSIEISGHEFTTPLKVETFCHPNDNFNRKYGVKRCLYVAFGHQKHQERARRAVERCMEYVQ